MYSPETEKNVVFKFGWFPPSVLPDGIFSFQIWVYFRALVGISIAIWNILRQFGICMAIWNINLVYFVVSC
jgi:hypothetical protein